MVLMCLLPHKFARRHANHVNIILSQKVWRWGGIQWHVVRTELQENRSVNVYNINVYARVYPKVSGLGHNEINNNNKHSLRSNTKGYGAKTHQTDSQNGDKTAHSGRELYHLQFSLQAASPETFGYILIYLIEGTDGRTDGRTDRSSWLKWSRKRKAKSETLKYYINMTTFQLLRKWHVFTRIHCMSSYLLADVLWPWSKAHLPVGMQYSCTQ
jgi:hypothetical protein